MLTIKYSSPISLKRKKANTSIIIQKFMYSLFFRYTQKNFYKKTQEAIDTSTIHKKAKQLTDKGHTDFYKHDQHKALIIY